MPTRAEGYPVSKDSTYFQFPLPCLAYGGPDHKERLRAVIDWCIVDRANTLQAKHTKTELKTMVKEISNSSLPGGFDQNSLEHLANVTARKTLCVCGGNTHSTIQTAAAVNSFLTGVAVKHGRSPNVRVRNDLLWDCIKGDMAWRDFSVLCAVYAVIGAKEYPVIITRQRIIAGALGYKSASLMTPELLLERKDGAQPLTENQVRRTLDELERRSLFTRMQASKRKVYFSNRMTRAEMAEQITRSRVKRATKVSKHRQEDRLLSARIAATIKAVNCPPESPRIHHPVAAAALLNNHEEHHFNIISRIEPVFKETSLKEAALIARARETPPPIENEREEEKQELTRRIDEYRAKGSTVALKAAKQLEVRLAKLRSEGLCTPSTPQTPENPTRTPGASQRAAHDEALPHK
jgi:hypothetical protein